MKKKAQSCRSRHQKNPSRNRDCTTAGFSIIYMPVTSGSLDLSHDSALSSSAAPAAVSSAAPPLSSGEDQAETVTQPTLDPGQEKFGEQLDNDHAQLAELTQLQVRHNSFKSQSTKLDLPINRRNRFVTANSSERLHKWPLHSVRSCATGSVSWTPIPRR
jgi:hypothetical protein